MSDFSSHTDIKAVRKRHRCAGCPGHVEVGEPAYRWTGSWDGQFGTAVYHVECRAAEIALNDLHDTRCGDEWSALTDMEGDDHPWLLADFPIVAVRYGITADTIRADEEEREACRVAWAESDAKRRSLATSRSQHEGAE